jgi:sugar transferase (PEP-CTERM/EpsH1 system associated)
MKLLLLTPQLPYPPRQGTSIRNYNLLAQLARRHDVDLISFLAPGDELAEDSLLHALCGRIATVHQPQRSTRRRARDTLLAPLPDMALRLESPAMRAQVEEWARGGPEGGYDLVQAEGIEMAQYGLLAAEVSGAAFVFDNHNCEYKLQQRNAFTDLSDWRHPKRLLAGGYSVVQWRKLRRYERDVCRAATAVVAVSAADRAALLELDPGLDVTVVSNGIDLAYYDEDYDGDGGVELPGAGAPAPVLLFTGKMDYRPNIDAMLWFGLKVLPLIRERCPGVRLQIVGMNPHPRLDVLRGDPSVEITGAVPDVRPYLRAAAVYVVPLRVGGGTRFKALEAMACARPIVSTSLGVEGLGAENGRELLLADRPDIFADAVLVLLRDEGKLRRYLGAQARRFVEERYRWETIVPRLEEVYARARENISTRINAD